MTSRISASVVLVDEIFETYGSLVFVRIGDKDASFNHTMVKVLDPSDDARLERALKSPTVSGTLITVTYN